MSMPVCVCLFMIISSELHVQSSPNLLCMLPMAEARSSGGVVIHYVFPVLWITHKLKVDVAAMLRQPGSHVALGLAYRNTCCRQWTLVTTSCRQALLGHSEYVWHHVCTSCPSIYSDKEVACA